MEYILQLLASSLPQKLEEGCGTAWIASWSTTATTLGPVVICMRQDVPNDFVSGSSDPRYSVSIPADNAGFTIPDDNAGLTINIEDADADAAALSAMPLTYRSVESLSFGGSGGVPALYPPYALLSGYESDNSSSGYHSPAVSDTDIFEDFQQSSPLGSSFLLPTVNVNSRNLTTEFANQPWQTSGQFAEGGLPYSLSYPYHLQHGRSAPSQPHLEAHPTPPSQFSLHDHYDYTPHELPASEPPSPTGSWSSQSPSDHDPSASLTPGYFNYHAQPAHAPSPTASESAASDASSNSARSSRGRDNFAINKRRKSPAIYHCPSCNEVDFTTRARLKSHIDSKHKGVRHRCPFSGCVKVFNHGPSLTRHFNDKHRSRGVPSGSQPLNQPRTHGQDAFIPA